MSRDLTPRRIGDLLREMRSDINLIRRQLVAAGLRLAARLSPEGQEISDWNNVTSAGWYWSIGGAGQPSTGTAQTRWVGEVTASSDDGAGGVCLKQILRRPDAAEQTTWTRTSCDAGATWSSWETALDLGTAYDLNQIDWTCQAVQLANANATLARNYPVAGRAGYLEVIANPIAEGNQVGVMQRYTDYQFSVPNSGRSQWVRTLSGSTWSPWRRLTDGTTHGPAAVRTATPSTYWEMWRDTTDGFVYVGNSTGGWRRFSGAISSPNTAWAVTTGTAPAVLFAGRSIDFTIPTVLEARETLQITMDPAATTTGYNFIGATSLIRNPTNTQVTVRLMQLNSHTTQAVQIAWQITPF